MKLTQHKYLPTTLALSLNFWQILDKSRKKILKKLGGDLQNFLRKFVRFFITLGLKILA